MQRYSQKRDSILACLRSTTSHPSAEWVYTQLKPQYPSLSLATVYRNLKQLVESGEIQSMGIVNGQERFDGNVAPHVHVVCTRCGKMADVPNLPLPEELALRISEATGFTLWQRDLQLSGLCPDCRNKINKT